METLVKQLLIDFPTEQKLVNVLSYGCDWLTLSKTNAFIIPFAFDINILCKCLTNSNIKLPEKFNIVEEIHYKRYADPKEWSLNADKFDPSFCYIFPKGEGCILKNYFEQMYCITSHNGIYTYTIKGPKYDDDII